MSQQERYLAVGLDLALLRMQVRFLSAEEIAVMGGIIEFMEPGKLQEHEFSLHLHNLNVETLRVIQRFVYVCWAFMHPPEVFPVNK